MIMMSSSETRFLEEKKKKKLLQDMISNTLLPVLAELYPVLDEKEEIGKDTVNFKLLQRYLDRGNHNNSDQEDPPSSDDDGPSKGTLAIKTHLQELIVLLGQLLSKEDSSAPPSQVLEEGILQMIKDLNRLIGEQIDQCMEQWKEQNPLLLLPSDRPEDDDNDEMEAVHLRREIVEGLQQPAKGMYGLLVDRLSISREEWFHTFGAPAEEFTFGVWTLIACGLLQAKPSRRGVVYEKVSVVWC
jgi:hypothetical protein